MKLSYFTMPLHPLRRDYTETLSEDRAAVMLAEELGFAEAFVGEHVTDRAETITSCLVFLASLAYQTERITLGSGTLNLPNAHPPNCWKLGRVANARLILLTGEWPRASSSPTTKRPRAPMR